MLLEAPYECSEDSSHVKMEVSKPKLLHHDSKEAF